MGIKILHLSTFDTVGGAARAAYRIHQGLQKIGLESQMLVQFKFGDEETIQAVEGKVAARLRAFADSVLLPPSKRQDLFSLQWFPDQLATKIAQINPDIVNLNWVCGGFVRIESLAKFNRPLVWTLQDMWAFTGGCHYSSGCQKYQLSCSACPQLNSHSPSDLSQWVWQRKFKNWPELNLTIVAPSRWMADCAQASALFKDLRIEIIPFGLDVSLFRPVASQTARELLGLPQDKQLILFGAISATSDQRKGFHLLQAALKRLSHTTWREQVEVVIFGADAPVQPLELGFKTHYLGYLQNSLSLQLAYAAADVMVVPSIEEAFGQTASEALACGTPAVVFKDTGLTDIVDHQQNGYAARYCDVEDLAKGIVWILENQERHQKLRAQAREKAEREFSIETQAYRYKLLYHQILNQSQIYARSEPDQRMAR